MSCGSEVSWSWRGSDGGGEGEEGAGSQRAKTKITITKSQSHKDVGNAKAASGAPSAAPATQKGARSRGDR